uniref:Uncharacterized protein n=1 Tax=Seriola lalandi dorsalis TaxID=1841481 RepID=A0A3B4XS55_SERLL
MLTDEVSQIQEVRYCLKTLREQMAARQNNNNNKVHTLCIHLKNGFLSTVLEHQSRLVEQSKRLQKAEEQSKERGQQVEELQRLLGNMEVESGILKDKMAAGEAELLQLKAGSEEGEEKEQREKIHHLDDMLKSQQRKVRHMIEQVFIYTSRLPNRVIRDLEEKVAFLEAEVRSCISLHSLKIYKRIH